MPSNKIHDLHEFMRQISSEMSAEYRRIQMRATEDPGTAGDQGEENWAELLRGWLPREYKVVTKGRIISQEGVTSPQVDVLVLNASYPEKLLNKKLYLAAGVAAAFECKTTLKSSHIAEAMENCVKIKELYPLRTGSPYRELHTPIIYGLLAHSHAWKGVQSLPVQNINSKLIEVDALHVVHPRSQLDILCVADLATWTSFKAAFIGPRQHPDWSVMGTAYGQNGSAITSYFAHTHGQAPHIELFTPIGVLISCLSRKLAWENPSLRDIADYYLAANISGFGGGDQRMWPSSIYSNEIRSRVEAGQFSSGKAATWDEWLMAFY